MNLIQTISWAIVELQSPAPDLQTLRLSLEKALEGACTQDLKNNQAQASLTRLQMVLGG